MTDTQSSSPQTMIRAIDALLAQVQDSEDFTNDELHKIRKVRSICLADIDLMEEAHHLLAKGRHSLTRKEESLSAFMEKLTPQDLESSVIKKMLEYFMKSHIKLDTQLRKIENSLREMYPHWEQSRQESIPLTPEHSHIYESDGDSDGPPSLQNLSPHSTEDV